jgi:hypothetical protein
MLEIPLSATRVVLKPGTAPTHQQATGSKKEFRPSTLRVAMDRDPAIAAG